MSQDLDVETIEFLAAGKKGLTAVLVEISKQFPVFHSIKAAGVIAFIAKSSSMDSLKNTAVISCAKGEQIVTILEVANRDGVFYCKIENYGVVDSMAEVLQAYTSQLEVHQKGAEILEGEVCLYNEPSFSPAESK